MEYPNKEFTKFPLNTAWAKDVEQSRRFTEGGQRNTIGYTKGSTKENVITRPSKTTSNAQRT